MGPYATGPPVTVVSPADQSPEHDVTSRARLRHRAQPRLSRGYQSTPVGARRDGGRGFEPEPPRPACSQCSRAIGRDTASPSCARTDRARRAVPIGVDPQQTGATVQRRRCGHRDDLERPTGTRAGRCRGRQRQSPRRFRSRSSPVDVGEEVGGSVRPAASRSGAASSSPPGTSVPPVTQTASPQLPALRLVHAVPARAHDSRSVRRRSSYQYRHRHSGSQPRAATAGRVYVREDLLVRDSWAGSPIDHRFRGNDPDRTTPRVVHDCEGPDCSSCTTATITGPTSLDRRCCIQPCI